MTRTTNTPVTRRRRKREKKLAKGYYGSKHRLTKTVREQVRKSLCHAYNGRKQRKRDFRSLWITRLNIACRNEGINYSHFIRLTKLAQIKLNRKQMSEMSINNIENFRFLIDKVKKPWN